jgi:hypothetical protein
MYPCHQWWKVSYVVTIQPFDHSSLYVKGPFAATDHTSFMAVEKFGLVTKGNSRWLVTFEHYFLDLLFELLAFDLDYGHLDSSSLDDLVV